MTQIDISAEWQKLCDEHEAVHAAYLQAFTMVNHKFAAVPYGASCANPMDSELSEFEKTWRVWEDVKKRMDAFIEQYA